MNDTLASLIPRLAEQRVLVIGDVILDEYVYGSATRMSREAPVPVLEFTERRFIAGGAANPAANIAALGSTALLMSVTGSDSAAQQLKRVLESAGIETGALVSDSTRPTTVKTRIMAQMGLRFPQQVARIDTLSRQPIDRKTERRLLKMLDAHIGTVNALLFSDYHSGLLMPSLVNTAREMAHPRGLLTAADAQGALEKYAGFSLIKCNADDARAYLNRPLRTDDDFTQAALELCAVLKVQGAMVITRGADGATLANVDGTHAHLPAPHVTDVYDTVGAGDTAIAVMTLAAAAGTGYAAAVQLANYASGIVVRRVGNYTPTPDELRAAVTHLEFGGD